MMFNHKTTIYNRCLNRVKGVSKCGQNVVKMSGVLCVS